MPTLRRIPWLRRAFLRRAFTAMLAIIMALATIKEVYAATITSGRPPDATYGVAYSHQVVATQQPGGTFTISSGSLPPGLSISASGLISGTPTTPGSNYDFTIRVSGPGAADTEFVNNFTVNKKTLTVTADAKSKTYGDANPALTYTATGFAFTDTAATVLNTGNLATTATTTSISGSYSITQGGLGLTTFGNARYTIAFTNGTLTVNKATLTVTPDNKTKTYGAANPALTFTTAGLVGSDTVAGMLTGNLGTTAATGSAVGSYPITQGTLVLTANGNARYALSFITDRTLTINKAPLTVTAEDKSKTYGDANPALTFTAGTFVNGDTAATALTGSLATTATTGSDAGSYPITQGTLAAANYTITFTPATLTVNKAPLTITANNLGKTYGDANPALTFTAGTFVNGDTAATALTGSLATTAATGSDAGSYPITQGDLAASNYTIAFTPGTLTIVKASLTVTAQDKSKTYGDANPALTFTAGTFVNGDTTATALTGNLATTATANSDAGDYPITQGDLAAANYAITFTPGTLTINKALLTVTAQDKSKTYGEANPALTYTVGGLANGDTEQGVLSGSLDTTATAASPSGTYPIIQGTLAVNNNYTLTFVGGTLTVNKATLSITAEDKSKTYGAANPALTYTVSGLVNNDTEAILTGALETDATTTSDAGSYSITQGTLDASTNYTISFTDGTLTINPAALTITAQSKTKTYGDVNPALTYTVSGLVNGDTITIIDGALATTATAASNVGTYPITQGTLDAGHNYTISFTAGALGVTPAPLTITAQNATRKVGTANPTFGVSYNGFVNGDDSSVLGGTLAFDTDAIIASPVGDYPVTPSGLTSTNYTITFADGTLSVVAKDVPVITWATPSPIDYGTPLSAAQLNAEASFNGLPLDGTFAYTPAANTVLEAGAVQTLSVIFTPTDGGTYAEITAYTTITVNKVTLSVTANNQTKTYGGANPTLTYTTSGLVNGDTDAAVLSGDLATNATHDSAVGTYQITQGSLAANGNYTLDFTGNTLTVTPADLSVTANAQTRIYGIPNPALTYTTSGLVNGDTSGSVLSGDLATNTTINSTVGAYQITQGTLAANGNYTLSFTGSSLTVTRAPLAVTANNVTRRVGSPNPNFTVNYSGFVNGEDASDLGGTLAVNTTATAASPAGTYPIVPSGLTSTNYAITFVNGALTVTDKNVPVITWATPAAISYGTQLSGTQLNATVSFNGQPVAGTFIYTPAAGTALSAGANQTLSVLFVPNDAANFAPVTKTTTITVNKASLIVTANDATRKVGEENPAFSVSYSGFVAGDDAADLGGTLVFSTPATPASPVGTYDVTPSGLTSSNYTITFVNGALTVTQTSFTIYLPLVLKP